MLPVQGLIRLVSALYLHYPQIFPIIQVRFKNFLRVAGSGLIRRGSAFYPVECQHYFMGFFWLFTCGGQA